VTTFAPPRRGILEAWRNISRAGSWWQYKMPPLLAVGYAEVLLRHGGRPAVAALVTGILALCPVAAFAHVVNDATDVEEDARRGKPNAMARLEPQKRFAVAAALAAAAWIPMLMLGPPRLSNILLAVELSLPLLYSVRPIRLKERGVLGVLADAAVAHVVPTLFVISLMQPYGDAPPLRGAIVGVSAAIWAGCLGLRGILVHQLLDRAADRAAGVHTFGGSTPVPVLRFLVLRVLLPVETIAVAAFTVALVPDASLLVPMAVLFGVAELLKIRAGWGVPYFVRAGAPEEPYVPLIFNDAYELWLPVALVAQLVTTDLLLAIVALLHVAVFYPNLRDRVEALRRLPGEVQRRRRAAIR
jgi:4-hydroxybenzoate polyprenyltransferase